MAFEWVKKKHLKILLIANAIVLAIIICLVSYLEFHSKSDAVEIMNSQWAESEFLIEEKIYDIDPGNEYVLYTNYACPYCAQFYSCEHDFNYTTRILLLDKDSERFKNQITVSAYMLKLYNEDVDLYKEAQEWVFQNQNDWVYLNDDDLINILNKQIGLSWDKSSLTDYMVLCETAENEAPTDLEFVPGLYSSGKRYDGYVLEIVSQI